MSDTPPKLQAVPADPKDGEEPKKSSVRSEAELRKALAALTQRLNIERTHLTSVAVGREDWSAVAEGAANVREIQAHIEALRFALGELSTIR